MVGLNVVGFVPVLVASTIGSVTGFASAYWIGRRYGRTLLGRGWLPFVTEELLRKVDVWFAKYHDWIIIGNRFLAGTRAVISFAAGITRMPFARTTLYCATSALAWNALLILAGQLLGERWQMIDQILSAYGWAVTILILVIITIVIIRRRRA
jgi:membrane protein DedA with SNARE-associated domain